MKEAKITLPEGCKAANIRVDGNVLSYDVVPQEKQIEEIECWIARDSNGFLYLYGGNKPLRGQSIWFSMNNSSSVQIDKRLFPSVKWEDSEPTKVRIKIETI